MGACVSTTAARDTGSRGVLVVGLDGSGTTTILYSLVLGKRLETIPTLGVNQEIISSNGLELKCWDVGGLDKVRPLWPQYTKDAHAVIFVVDAADDVRMKLAAKEIASLYSTNSKKITIAPDKPLLIYANKQDKTDAVSGAEVAKTLKVSTLGVKTYKVFESSAEDKDSLWAGINWLTEQLKQKPAKKPTQK